MVHRSAFIAVALCLAAAPAARAVNELGMYVAVDGWLIDGYAYCGPVEVHLVVLDPYNPVRDRPITQVGGFECRVELPPQVTLLEVRLPPGSVNFRTWPELLVGVSVPVPASDGHVVLATIVVEVPEDLGSPVYALLQPVNPPYQSIPGSAAIMDAEDDYRLVAVAPAGGSYDRPIFGFGYTLDHPWGARMSGCIVALADVTWGALKSSYR
ncbi:MAG: hypothetical protein R6X25_02580 [Candidatus Krumholzibacteriia bacterium]